MLELLATKHDDWVRIALRMTYDIDEARDLVQDMYIRLDRLGKTKEQIMFKDTVNRYFVWTVLFNMFKVSRRTKVHKKLDACEYTGNEDIELDEYDINEEHYTSTEVLGRRIKEATEGWSPYDKQLFSLYYIQGQSLRQISRGANIGLSAIHNGVKNIREELRNRLSEDLMDYFNGDYDKI